MKLYKSLLILVVLFSILLLPKNAFLQNRPSVAAERCSLSQSYLKNIQRNRDLHARVDRLQAYQYIYQRMDVFVRRLERNNQTQSVEMRASLDQLKQQLEVFKKNYEQYDQAREAVATLGDCKTRLPEFQDKLGIARSKRSVLQEDLLQIQKILDTTIKNQLETIQNAASSNTNEARE